MIDIRNLWRDGEQNEDTVITTLVAGQHNVQGDTHPVGGGSTGIHPGGPLQLRVAGLLRPAQRGGAGQQPVGGPFGFEHPFIRGLASIQAGQPEHLRCLVKSA